MKIIPAAAVTDALVLVSIGSDQFLGLTVQEFQTALERGRVLAGNTAARPGGNGDGAEKLLTAQEISLATGIPSGWYLECARRREIPFVKLGRYPRFQLSKVVEHGLVTPPAEPGGQWGRQKGKRVVP